MSTPSRLASFPELSRRLRAFDIHLAAPDDTDKLYTCLQDCLV